MSVIVAERIFVRAPEVIFWVGVPAVLWALIIGGGVYSGKQRFLTFGAAVWVGGFGLVFGIAGLLTNIPDDAWPSQAALAGLPLLAGVGLLVIGALIGLVALLLGQDSVDSSAAPASIGRLIGGQPRSEDSVDSSGDGDQESDV